MTTKSCTSHHCSLVSNILDLRNKSTDPKIIKFSNDKEEYTPWSNRTDKGCWHCGHSFDTFPVGIPIKVIRPSLRSIVMDKPDDIPEQKWILRNSEFHLYGNFCSFPCTRAYMQFDVTENTDTQVGMDERMHGESLMNLHSLFRFVYPSLQLKSGCGIPCALPWQELSFFGGKYSIEDFRHLGNYNLSQCIEFTAFGELSNQFDLYNYIREANLKHVAPTKIKQICALPIPIAKAKEYANLQRCEPHPFWMRSDNHRNREITPELPAKKGIDDDVDRIEIEPEWEDIRTRRGKDEVSETYIDDVVADFQKKKTAVSESMKGLKPKSMRRKLVSSIWKQREKSLMKIALPPKEKAPRNNKKFQNKKIVLSKEEIAAKKAKEKEFSELAVSIAQSAGKSLIETVEEAAKPPEQQGGAKKKNSLINYGDDDD